MSVRSFLRDDAQMSRGSPAMSSNLYCGFTQS
jgi:hypothetical protein